jgi:hypothetical protein
MQKKQTKEAGTQKPAGTRRNHGPCVYFDTSVKNTARRKAQNRWRADVTIGERRYRKRGGNRDELYEWIRGIKENNS